MERKTINKGDLLTVDVNFNYTDQPQVVFLCAVTYISRILSISKNDFGHIPTVEQNTKLVFLTEQGIDRVVSLEKTNEDSHLKFLASEFVRLFNQGIVSVKQEGFFDVSLSSCVDDLTPLMKSILNVGFGKVETIEILGIKESYTV